METVKAKVISIASPAEEIKKLYISAFPKEERMPWCALRALTVLPAVRLTGYYDRNALLGFTYSVETDDIFFIMFFAVSEALRGKGCGSAILDFIKKTNPQKDVILNVELLDESAENYQQRLRRFKFYQKNGFFDTGRNIDEIGGTFRVLSTRPAFDTKAYIRVFRKMSLGLWKPPITDPVADKAKVTEVVAALIWEQDKFMICQRPENKARGLLWEFVGGKVEPGETKEQALIRECREELAITLNVGEVFMDVVHSYPDLKVHLTLFNAVIAEGTPQMLEHNDIRWITPEEIPRYAFCPADEEILRKIREVHK